MRKFRQMLFMLIGLMANCLCAQHSTSLWDDTQVSSLQVTIPSDSLDSLYAHPYATHYYPCTVVYDDGSARDTLLEIGLRLRGNTSRDAAKKSFKLSFNAFVPGRKYQGVDKLNLNGQHNDPTMAREKLFYDVWNACGMPQRRTTFLRLYINQVYRGLYTCLEEIDKDWLTQTMGEHAGNLYKCTYPADLVYFSTDQLTYKSIPSSSVTGGRAYDLQTNAILDDYTDLVDLITQLNRVPDAQFAAEIVQYLNVNAMLKALAIDVATGNWDDYAYNKNNYFLYHRLGTGQMEFITYDTDNTFGVDWVQEDWASRDCSDWLSHNEPRPLASKLLDVPAFRERYYAYLDTITQTITRPATIFPKIDSLHNLIYAAAVDDSFRTLDYGYTLADFDLGFSGTVDGHTPYGIKPFLGTRYMQTVTQLATEIDASIAIQQQQFVLFPNPMLQAGSAKVHAKTPVRKDLIVQVVNTMGQVCSQQVWPCYLSSHAIELQKLPIGSYWLRISGPETNVTISFCVQ